MDSAGTVRSFVDSIGTPAVRGVLHSPAEPLGDGLVLAHGAGSNRDAPLLIALAEQLCAAGLVVLRCDLPFRQQRPHGPPRGSAAEDQAGLRRAIEVIKPFVPGRISLGGQSYGGRQATMLVAEEPGIAAGLLVLSYPLHPPGKPAQVRTKHLSNIRIPSCFVSGSKDPFGTPAEIQAAMDLLAGHASFLLIEGAGHDLGFGRRVSKKMADVPTRIVEVFLNMFRK